MGSTKARKIPFTRENAKKIKSAVLVFFLIGLLAFIIGAIK